MQMIADDGVEFRANIDCLTSYQSNYHHSINVNSFIEMLWRAHAYHKRKQISLVWWIEKIVHFGVEFDQTKTQKNKIFD